MEKAAMGRYFNNQQKMLWENNPEPWSLPCLEGALGRLTIIPVMYDFDLFL